MTTIIFLSSVARAEMKDKVSVISAYKLVLDPTTKAVSNAGHPINQILLEIIQLIFEAAVPISKRGFKQAITISHVSKYWRNVALATPTLWTYIQCSMRQPESNLTEFWDEMCKRARNAAAVVYIHDIFSQPDGQPSNCIRLCPLDKLSRIKTLRLEGEGESLIQEICSSTFVPPTRPFEVLSLHIRNPDYGKPLNEIALDRFPRFHELYLLGFIEGVLVSHPSLRPVHTLRLHKSSLPLRPLLRHLPNLSFLELDPHAVLSLDPSLPTPLIIPNLLTLKALGAYAWIPLISCPRLTTLIIDYITIRFNRQNLLTWISSHPTIHTLHLNCLDAYDQLAVAAPQLTELRVMEQRGANAIPAEVFYRGFPKLQILEIVDSGNLLTMEKFEDLVTARCLPAEAKRNRREQSLTKFSLGVMISLNKSLPVRWKRSELYHMARKRIGFSELPSPDDTIFSLRKGDPDGWMQMALEWA